MFQNAEWIWGASASVPDEYYDFRLNFTAVRGRSYRLYLSCDTDYALYSGEKLLAHGQYPDYADYKVYDMLDLSENVADGENELILTVWYQGVDFATYVTKRAGVIFVLTEEDKPILTSSPSIQSRVSAGYRPHLESKISNQLGLTFAYDATVPAGAFADSYLVEGPTKNLVPRPIEKLDAPVRMPARVVQSGGFLYRGEAAPAVRMQEAALVCRTQRAALDGVHGVTFTAKPGEDGVYLIADMGRETAGLLDLDFECADACELLIGWGEHLADGRCRTSIRNFSVEFHAAAGHTRFVHPLRRLGGRYVQLFFAAPAVTVYYAGIAETAYPVQRKPFACGNTLRERIYDVCVNTLRQCMHEHYEDCPWREQALYTLDSRNQMLCGYYAFGETRFPRACLELMSHGRRPDGLLMLTYPAGTDYPIPTFSLVHFIQMREYLKYSDDTAFVRGKYAFLKSLMQTFLDRRNGDGLIPIFGTDPKIWDFYEWADGMDGCAHEAKEGTVEAPLNAFFSLALQNLAAIAETLDYESDADAYRTIAENVNTALYQNFFDEQNGLFRSFSDRRFDRYSVLTNSVCLLCGAAEKADKSRIFDLLVCNGGESGDVPQTLAGKKLVPNTLSMNSFRFDALLAADKERFAPVILNEIDRSYFAMLQKDATSFWETAKGEADFRNAGSLCHGWTALPIYYYETLLA